MMYVVQIVVGCLFAWLAYGFLQDRPDENGPMVILLFGAWGFMAAYGVTLLWIKISGHRKRQTLIPPPAKPSLDYHAPLAKPCRNGTIHQAPGPSVSLRDSRQLARLP